MISEEKRIETIVHGCMTDCYLEINTDALRQKLKKEISKILSPPEYEIICDERNNTVEIIDNNQLIVDVVYPNGTIRVEFNAEEYIIPFVEIIG